MSEYHPTIGLEIHAELNVLSKMFCSCLNNPDETRPNVHICPVCMAHPGTLPVINREAVRKVLQVGAALGGSLADRTYFDRKNYFYPDIPKGFQISQYKDPLVSGGELAGVLITRVHLEEDTARSSHEKGGSLVDFNRAGVALMELVTEPCITSADVAGTFARELQLLLRYLGVGEANMEKGEMRVEANISVAPATEINKKDGEPRVLGTKVEVKNLNSFRSVERAIAYEIQRQSEVLAGGGVIVQETRGWDENKQATYSQRKKESSHDYRYFPEPDLPELMLSEISEWAPSVLRESLPELPAARRARYLALGLKAEDADMFVRERALGDFFDEAKTGLSAEAALLIVNYLSSDIAGAREAGRITDLWLTTENAVRIGKLISLIHGGMLSSRGAKDTLTLMFSSPEDPETLAREHDLIQKSDTAALEAIVQHVIASQSAAVGEYRAGKTAALQFLVGQGMKESKGSANPALLRSIFERLLS